MIDGGKGGSSTKTGLHFEKRKDLLSMIANLKNYDVKDRTIFFNGGKIAVSIQKHRLYSFLKEEGLDWRQYISKKLLPDEAIFVFDKRTVYIVEMKFQKTEGSVDEKLQTCDFKKKQYQKLFSPLGINTEYYYVLNNWFKDKRYVDVLEYVRSVGCDYFFEVLPLERIGLKKSI
ncbi:MAG TPA: hypothetical protein ENN13_05175 [Candidatus Altiarchaeales archaeon]|nr:hypothetical protein [Candidatus Altiarchaeales archaeon]